MKKTISIHLMGSVFNIEENAYASLNKYLEEIRLNLSNQEGCEEIMEDIEMRIAELFQERLTPSKEVITAIDLEEVIHILGQPNAFGDSEEEIPNPANSSTNDTKVKRLFRDRENGTFGGVCSGLGHYFDIDPLIIRILFVTLFLFAGSGVLLYILLVIFIPEAKTTADKIEMHGNPVNIDSIKEHFNQFTDTISEKARATKIKSKVKIAVDKGVSQSRVIIEIISKIIGIACVAGGILLFILFSILLTSDIGLLPFIGETRIPNLHEAIDIIFPLNNWTSFIMISLIIVILVPLVALIITGMRIITKNRKYSKELTWGLSIIWTIAAIFLMVNSIGIANEIKEFKVIKETIKLDDASANQLLIDCENDQFFSNHFNPNHGEDIVELIKTDALKIYIGVTELTIIESDITGDFELYMYRHARGKNEKEAIEHCEKIDFSFQSNGSAIYLPPFFSFPKTDKYRGQYLSFKLIVPEGKSVKFGPNINRLKLNSNNPDYWLDSSSNWE